MMEMYMRAWQLGYKDIDIEPMAPPKVKITARRVWAEPVVVVGDGVLDACEKLLRVLT